MNSSKHTQGPWVVDGRRVYGAPDIRSSHPNGRPLICQLASESYGCDSTFGLSREDAISEGRMDGALVAPDANLIAAAPGLLAALRHIVNDTPTPGDDAVLTVKGYNLACAAIAKAEGRTP